MNVYLSSTLDDLREFRAKVIEVLRRSGHLVKDSYEASPTPVVESCLADVRACDVYLGLFAFRHGWCPGIDRGDTRSITEMEYRQACESGKPCLVFLASDEWPRNKCDRGDALDRIEALRSELQQRHRPALFRDPDDLAVSVTTAIAELLRVRPELEQRSSPEARATLAELRSTGLRIFKLYAFKRIYEELLEIYFDALVLRSGNPAEYTPQALRTVSRTARDRLATCRGVAGNADNHLSEADRTLAGNWLGTVDASVTALEEWVRTSPPDAAGADGRLVDAVDNFNWTLTTVLNNVDAVAEDVWDQVRLGQFGTLIARIGAAAPPDFSARVTDIYHALSVEPTLAARCNLLSREHDLLDKALGIFSSLQREVDRLDVMELRMRCKTLRRCVEHARAEWSKFEEISRSLGDSWAVDFLDDSRIQWEEIDALGAELNVSIDNLAQAGSSIPPDLLDKLRRVRRFLEYHFLSVHKAMVEAYRQLKTSLGDELVATPLAEAEHEC